MLIVRKKNAEKDNKNDISLKLYSYFVGYYAKSQYLCICNRNKI